MEQDEVTIDLNDLFKRMFRRWYFLVLAIAIGCAAGFAYDYVSYKKAEASWQAQKEVADTEETGISIEEVEKQASLQNYIGDMELCEYYREYLEKSVLMNADVSDMKQETITYLIETDSEKDYSAFYGLTLDETMLEEASESTGIDEAYISELVSISNPERSDSLADVIAQAASQQSDSYGTNRKIQYVMTVTIVGADESQCQGIAEAAEHLFDRVAKNLANSNLSVTKTGDYLSSYQNDELASKKSSVNESYQTAVSNAKKAYDALSDDEKETADAMLEKGVQWSSVMGSSSAESSDNNEASIEEAPVLTVSKKHLAIGAIVMLLLWCVVEVCLYFHDDHVKTESELSDNFGLNRLGSVSDDTTEQYVLKSLSALLAQKKAGSLFLADEIQSEKSEKLCNEIREKNPGMKVSSGSVLSTGSDNSALLESDAVVILSSPDQTKRKDVQTVIQTCQFGGKELLGYVSIASQHTEKK